MSSLRNAVKRVTHKERSQPQSRAHLGLLEKKPDYRLRSKDYHAKQQRLTAMRIKVANRNPDEYYMGMNSSKVDGFSGNNSGRQVKTDEARMKEMVEKGLGVDAVKIMKDQDLAYVRMQRLMDGKKIEKMQSSLHYLEVGDGGEGGKSNISKKRKHTIFIDGDQMNLEEFDAVKHFDTLPELFDRSFNRPRIETIEREALKGLGNKITNRDLTSNNYNDIEKDGEEDPAENVTLSDKQLLKQNKIRRRVEHRIARSRSAAYAEMELRNERMEKLKIAEAHLVVEKQCRMKGRKRKIVGKEGGEDGKPAVYKWRRIRSK